MAKEALFNILNNHFDFEGLDVLDLFGGTGSISLEFASRGADTVTTVELNRKCVLFIEKIANDFQFDSLQVVKGSVFGFLKFTRSKYDLIFADPPYDMEESMQIPDLVFEQDLLKEGAWLIVEHARDKDFSSHPRFTQLRRYGRVHFSIFE